MTSKNWRRAMTAETTETTERTHLTQSDINIIETMRAAGAQLVYMDTGTPYFQYGRTYRGIERKAIERLDRRVYIYVHAPDDVQVQFYPTGSAWYNLQSRDFKTMKGALNWSERNIK